MTYESSRSLSSRAHDRLPDNLGDLVAGKYYAQVNYEDAGCVKVDNPDIFFPTKGGSQENTRIAREICMGCTKWLGCLVTELTLGSTKQQGIRAGLTERERRDILTKLAKQRKAK